MAIKQHATKTSMGRAPAPPPASAPAPAQPKEPPPASALGKSAPPYASACKGPEDHKGLGIKMKPNTHRNKSLNVHPVIKPSGGAGETAQRRQRYRQKREGQLKKPTYWETRVKIGSF